MNYEIPYESQVLWKVMSMASHFRLVDFFMVAIENRMGHTFYLVELFSGSSSVARAAEASLPPGWKFKVHSVDIHPKYNPTTAIDILQWDYKPVLAEFLAPIGPKDVVWVHGSPPCTEYSFAKTTGVRDLPLADGLVKRALRIIKYCKNIAHASETSFFWTLENPVGLLRNRKFMKRLQPYQHTTSYCKWGKNFRKDTDIWTNVPDLDLPMCRKGTYCQQKELAGFHATTAQSGPPSKGNQETKGSGSGENVYPLPKRLTSFMVQSALKHLSHTVSRRQHDKRRAEASPAPHDQLKFKRSPKKMRN